MRDSPDTDRLLDWLAEVAAVRLLRSGWSVTQTARATGVSRDIVRFYARIVAAAGADRSAVEMVGPPPRVVDRELTALWRGDCGRISGEDAP